MLESRFKPGDIVTWVSQAQGVEKEKTGAVIQLVAPMQSAFDIFGTLGRNARRKFDGDKNAKHHRVMIKVPRGGKSQLFDVHCIVANTLLMQMKKVGDQG